MMKTTRQKVAGKQLDMFQVTKSKSGVNYIRNGQYIYIDNFFNEHESEEFFTALIEDVMWKQEKMYMYGKELKFPRLMAWYGDPDMEYTFSSKKFKPLTWIPSLIKIKNQVEEELDLSFNSVLLNRYRDGYDSIAWHSDDEKSLGKNPIIASVNFGAERIFQLKHINTKERIDIKLENGSLLVMLGEMQHYWQHKIPKTKKVIGERINLTFRNLFP